MHSQDQLDAIEKITIAVIAEQLGLKTEEIKHTSTKHELGSDSLDDVEIIMALEEEFDIEIPDSVAFNISDVGYIITHLQSLADITIDERTWREVERMQHERELKLAKKKPVPKPAPVSVPEMKGIMSDEEFLLIVKQMKGSLDDRSTAAARLVLVHGMTQKAAYLQTESSASNVCGSVKRIRDRHEDILGAYNARFKGQLRG